MVITYDKILTNAPKSKLGVYMVNHMFDCIKSLRANGFSWDDVEKQLNEGLQICDNPNRVSARTISSAFNKRVREIKEENTISVTDGDVSLSDNSFGTQSSFTMPLSPNTVVEIKLSKNINALDGRELLRLQEYLSSMSASVAGYH